MAVPLLVIPANPGGGFCDLWRADFEATGTDPWLIEMP